MMNSLGLSPLPTLRTDEESASFLMEKEGFVDEAVVAALVAAPHPVSKRRQPFHEDLALCADDLDFAGWRIPSTVSEPFRGIGVTQEATRASHQRPVPPLIQEPGLGESHRGDHRWWLAGLAGILSTMLFSVLLLSLSYRPSSVSDAIPSPNSVARLKVVAPTAPRTPEVNTELTDISPADR